MFETKKEIFTAIDVRPFLPRIRRTAASLRPDSLLMFQLWKNATEKKAMDCEDDGMESKEIEEEE